MTSIQGKYHFNNHYRLVSDDTVQKGTNLNLFDTQGILTFDLAIDPYTLSLLFYILYILLYIYISLERDVPGYPNPPPIVRYFQKQQARAATTIARYGVTI